MKIVFFNRFFHPDTSATSQILSDLAFHLASAGGDIHVVTSKVPGGEAGRETIRGVTVHRVTSAVVGPHGLARRALAYVGYYRGARAAARRLLQAGDIAILKTDPPMLSAFVGEVAARQGAKVVAWIQDIFPEIAREFGVPGMKGALYRAILRKRNASLVACDRVVAIGERMAARLAAEGVPAEKLAVIHNWADGQALRPVAHEANPLRGRWGLHEKFVVGYSGNLGRVHEFDTMLDAARRLSAREDIVFLIVGRGPRLADVEERVRRERIGNVVLQPPQERTGLAQSLGVADVHVCVLQPRFDALVLPSKLYGIMAAARPVIFVGDPSGESAALIARENCGVTVSTGDSEGLAREIVRLHRDRPARDAMGGRAREAFERDFAQDKALAQWLDILSPLGYRSAGNAR